MSANTTTMNAKQAAEFLGCSVQKIYQLEKEGLIQRLPGFVHLRFSVYALERYLGKSAHPEAQQ